MNIFFKNLLNHKMLNKKNLITGLFATTTFIVTVYGCEYIDKSKIKKDLIEIYRDTRF